MPITAVVNTRTQYRNSDGDVLLSTEEGKIFNGIFLLKSLAEVEEFIAALKAAAEQAKLPPVKPVTENDRLYAEIEELAQKRRG
jgi:hypothetical protein